MHDLELRACCARAGMSEAQTSHLLEMIADSPARRPGKAALRNVVPVLASQKNGRQVWMESHTVERLYAYQLEFDPSVLAYYSQVPCRGVERVKSEGKDTSPMRLPTSSSSGATL